MFQKQLMMRKVLYALAPILVFSIYLYGIRVLFLGILTFGAAYLTEYLFLKNQKNKKVTEAVLVTAALYLLSLPPLTPYWIAIIGIIFGVGFGKMAFGGFGRNVFNPAIVGRLFIYISFPTTMNKWMIPTKYGVDSVASATPLIESKISGALTSSLDLFLGVRAGSIGESAIILILLGGAYLIKTKTANWKTMAGTLIGYILLQGALFATGNPISPLNGILSGSFLFVTVFMVTDPVSAPKKPKSIWIYGIMIGASIALIRNFSLFPEGTSFAILLGNLFAPLLDEIFNKINQNKKKKGAVKA